ncbi:MAG: hypothetical protein NTU85_02400 [Candidatus Kaiserbacteria bacterium]|nr:hypothetical protein [Candidatus Kaiserbacteria bacterium]
MRVLRTIGVIGSATALLLSATVVFAEGQVTSTSRVEATSDYRAIAASTTARMQVVRIEAQDRMQTQREKVTQRMMDIQDKAKQQMAQNLAVQFDNLNSTWTDHFMNLLDHYDSIVQKIQDRATISGNAGKDIASTTVAIKSAHDVIASARTAVIAQAEKTYTLDPSTISKTATTTSSGQEKIMKGLRTSFQKLHTTLFKDLFALRDGAMKDARKSVQNALQTLDK